jgi:protein subunit release factor A
MDKQLLAALDNLSIALEMLSESLSKKDSSSPVASAVKSGNFEDQLKSISKGIADIKSDNKKILDNQETILKLQREKKDKSMNAFEGSGKENNKKMLKDGISIIVLIDTLE